MMKIFTLSIVAFTAFSFFAGACKSDELSFKDRHYNIIWQYLLYH